MYVAKTLRLMNFLVRGGFDCLKIQRDIYNDNYVVFLFEDSKGLRNYLGAYK